MRMMQSQHLRMHGLCRRGNHISNCCGCRANGNNPAKMQPWFFHQHFCALLNKLFMRHAERSSIRDLLSMCALFIKPGAADIDGPVADATGCLPYFTSSKIGGKKCLDKIWRKRGRRQQNATSQHPCPVHQTADSMEIVNIKIIRLIQHQVAG